VRTVWAMLAGIDYHCRCCRADGAAQGTHTHTHTHTHTNAEEQEYGLATQPLLATLGVSVCWRGPRREAAR
jgi:hypothetical protein